jgi:hypothetical protein
VVALRPRPLIMAGEKDHPGDGRQAAWGRALQDCDWLTFTLGKQPDLPWAGTVTFIQPAGPYGSGDGVGTSDGSTVGDGVCEGVGVRVGSAGL